MLPLLRGHAAPRGVLRPGELGESFAELGLPVHEFHGLDLVLLLELLYFVGLLLPRAELVLEGVALDAQLVDLGKGVGTRFSS